MTNAEIYMIAMEQSAIDCNCTPEDFTKNENVMVISGEAPGARKYLKLPFLCDLVSYGKNIVASVSPELKEIVENYINRCSKPYKCFEVPYMQALNEEIRDMGLTICFMAEYFLPDFGKLGQFGKSEQFEQFELRVLEKEELEGLYLPQWGNALCDYRKELDMLAVGAYDGENLVGLSGCSADCDTMGYDF